MAKYAVVLLNIGGPSDLSEVKDYLFNFFYDKNIISLPRPLRYILARYISGKRAPKSQKIYGLIGGKSPILENTIEQALALEYELIRRDISAKSFVCMRYWHPRANEVIEKIKKYAPDEIVLLPLYPQYSNATTKSAYEDFVKNYNKSGLNIPVKSIDSFYDNEKYVFIMSELIREKINELNHNDYKILFSAHGLPKKNIAKGDVYEEHIKKTVANIVKNMGLNKENWGLCYQSRVGRQDWLQPYSEDEIKTCGSLNKSIIMVPLSFVNDHSETLVEMDIDYRKLALSCGCPEFKRVRVPANEAVFIEALADEISKII